MKRETATIERYHVRGTPHYCLAVSYRGKDFTPAVSSGSVLQEWIPGDADGVARCREAAKRCGFTHVKFTGDWDRMTKPRGGKL